MNLKPLRSQEIYDNLCKNFEIFDKRYEWKILGNLIKREKSDSTLLTGVV